MIPRKHIEILKLICDKTKKINWALTGSLSQFLLKMDLKPNDIDIITDDIEFFKKEFQESIIENYNISNIEFEGEICKLRIDNIIIEIIGSPKNKLSDMWGEEKKLKKKIFVDFEGYKIPCIPLVQQYKAYIMLGRFEKAELIKKELNL